MKVKNKGIQKLVLSIVIGLSILIYVPVIKAEESLPIQLEIEQVYNDESKQVDIEISALFDDAIHIKSIELYGEAKTWNGLDTIDYSLNANGEYQIKIDYEIDNEEKQYTENLTVDMMETAIEGDEEDLADKEINSIVATPFANEINKDGVSISTNKDSGFKWWEDSQAFTSTLKIVKDRSLPEGSTRTVELSLASEGILVVNNLSTVDGINILDAKKIDNYTISYTISNDAIPNDGINIITSYSSIGSYNESIGLIMLRKAKEEGISNWGIELTAKMKGETVATHKVSVTKELQKLENTNTSLIEDIYFVGDGTTVSGNLSDLKLSSEGFTYTGETPYSYHSLKLSLTKNDHLPIGNLYLKVYTPEGFQYGSSTFVDETTNESYGELRYATNRNYTGGLGAYNSGNETLGATNPLTVSYYGFSSSVNSWGNYFIGVSGKENQFISLSVATARENGVHAAKPLDLLNDKMYTSKNSSIITYDQIKLLEDGSYTIEEKEYDLGKMTIQSNSDTRTKIKRFTTSTSAPYNVSSEDEDVVYSGTMKNIMNNVDINKNNIVQHHLGGTITFDVPKEFDITELSMPRCYNQKVQIVEKYTYYLSNGESVTTPVYSENKKHTVVFEIPEGEKVVKVVAHLKDDYGFGNMYRQAINETEMRGTFSKPTSGSTIVMNIKVESENDETETGRFAWTYIEQPDIASFSLNSGDTHLGSDTSSNKNGNYVSLDLRAIDQQSSRTYEDVTIDMIGGSSLETKTLSNTFRVYGSKLKYKGNGYVVYTTNLNEERKIQIVSDGKELTGMKSFNLQENEYITDIKVTFDSVKWTGEGAYGNALILMFYYRLDREYPQETIDYTQDSFSGKWTTKFNAKDMNEKTAVSNYEYYLWSNVSIIPASKNKIQYADSIAKGDLIPHDLEIKTPVYFSELNTMGGGYNYPITYAKGTKLYLKLNENFDYFGDDPKITKEKDKNGDTWIVYDVSQYPIDISLYDSFTRFIIPADTIYCKQSALSNEDYVIFEKIYLDIAPQLQNEDQPPYFRYTRGVFPEPLFAEDDVYGITGSEDKEAENRLVNIPYTQKTMVIASESNDLIISTGVDGEHGEGDLLFTAEHNNKLSAAITIDSSMKKYSNYKLIINLPQKGGKSFIGSEGSSNYLEVENQFSVSLRDVIVSDELKQLGYTVEYTNGKARSFFRSANQQVIITFNELPANSIQTIYFQFQLDDLNDLYNLNEGDMIGLSAQAQFDYVPVDSFGIATGTTRSDSINSTNIGSYKFNYYEISGIVFQKSLTSENVGLYTPEDGDILGGIASMPFKDLDTGNIYTAAVDSNGNYSLKLPLKKTSYRLSPYLSDNPSEIALGALDASVFTLTDNKSDYIDENISTNFPRNYTEDGAVFSFNTNGRTAQKYVSDFSKVNVGLVDASYNPQPPIVIEKPKPEQPIKPKPEQPIKPKPPIVIEKPEQPNLINRPVIKKPTPTIIKKLSILQELPQLFPKLKESINKYFKVFETDARKGSSQVEDEKTSVYKNQDSQKNIIDRILDDNKHGINREAVSFLGLGLLLLLLSLLLRRRKKEQL